jgi:hypothetical protein
MNCSIYRFFLWKDILGHELLVALRRVVLLNFVVGILPADSPSIRRCRWLQRCLIVAENHDEN